VSYKFHPAAEAEHLEIIGYFESKRPGLGASYLADFESIMAKVCDSPQRYPSEGRFDVRRVRMGWFPYTVFYREVSGAVQVLAIAHHRRRPGYWLERR
jgi:plasmid stabilization system protein ParE